MSAVINDGELLKFHALRLDTIPKMAAASRLDHRFDFHPIARYYHNPIPGAVFFGLRLDQ